MLPIPPTIMPPKSDADCITKMKAWQAQLNKELRQAQEEVYREEKECAEVAR